MALDFHPADFEPVLKALAAAGLPVLEQTLTTVVADSVAGPFGGFVSQAVNPLWSSLNHALGLDAETPPAATAAAISALPPETAQEKLSAVQEQHAYLLADFRARSAATLAAAQEADRVALTGDAAQDAINARAAESASPFVYGYRPAACWVLLSLLALYAVLPVVAWVIHGCQTGDWANPPRLPWYVLALFAALLGVLAALRSWDKRNGTASLPPAAPAALAPLPPGPPNRRAR